MTKPVSKVSEEYFQAPRFSEEDARQLTSRLGWEFSEAFLAHLNRAVDGYELGKNVIRLYRSPSEQKAILNRTERASGKLVEYIDRLSTTEKVHRIVAELMQAGANHTNIHNQIYYNNSEDRMRFLGYCLSEKLKVFPEFMTAYISVTKEELDRFNHKRGDAEGLVNYATSIENVKFAALFIERDDIIKISFRSKGNFS